MIARARAYLALMARTTGRGAVAGLLAMQLLVAVTEGAGLALLAPVLESLAGRDRLTVPGLGVEVSIQVAFGTVFAVIVLRALGQWQVAVRSLDLRLRTIDTLRLDLLDGLYAADWRYLVGQRRSHVVQRLTTEVERAQAALTTLLTLIVMTLLLTATVGVAVLVSVVVGGATALVLLLMAALTRRSVRSSVRSGTALSAQTESFGAAVSDSLGSLRLIRAHDAAAAWSRVVAEEARRSREVRRSYVRRSSAVVAGLGVVVVGAVLVLIPVGRATGLNFAELATLAVLATRILGAAQAVLSSSQQFANDAPALDRLAEFRDEVARHRESSAPAAGAPGPAAGTGPLIALRHVSFRYAPELPPVLLDVSFEVPRGGLVALTGASGAGKSTVLDLLLGLLRPDSGSLLVDGSPLGAVERWRARVGYVPQQTVLVPGSVWQNLVWSLPSGRSVSEQDAWLALKSACLDEVVARLPDGLHTVLSETAALSGGEQQRLSIARALLRDPDLLLLDEATGALDVDTEERVLQNLLGGRRAVVLVTHRLTARVLADADAVLTVADGTVRAGNAAADGAGRHRAAGTGD